MAMSADEGMKGENVLFRDADGADNPALLARPGDEPNTWSLWCFPGDGTTPRFVRNVPEGKEANTWRSLYSFVKEGTERASQERDGLYFCLGQRCTGATWPADFSPHTEECLGEHEHEANLERHGELVARVTSDGRVELCNPAGRPLGRSYWRIGGELEQATWKHPLGVLIERHFRADLVDDQAVAVAQLDDGGPEDAAGRLLRLALERGAFARAQEPSAPPSDSSVAELAGEVFAASGHGEFLAMRELNRVYHERNTLACALVRLTLDAGGVAGVASDPEEADTPFERVAIVELATGRVGWHMDGRDQDLVDMVRTLPAYPHEWEQFGSGENWDRVRRFIVSSAR